MTESITTEEKSTISAYDKSPAALAEKYWQLWGWEKELKIFYNYLPKGKVIEIGCGAGNAAFRLINLGYDYLGIDASRGMIQEARRRVPSAKFINENLFNLSLPENSFDGFWAVAVLLHIPKERIPAALKKIHQLVKTEGIGFIAVKEGDGEKFIKDNELGSERFYSFFNMQELADILEKCGFKVLAKHSVPDLRDKTTRWLAFFVKIKK